MVRPANKIPVRVLFLNQYFLRPRSHRHPAAGDRGCAHCLRARGPVRFLRPRLPWRPKARLADAAGELRGLWALFRAALAAGRVDAVISATSPPLLVVLAAIVAKIRGARHYHWLFDMYPELATALGEVPEGAMARLFSAATRWAYRSADCVVALDEDMAARLKDHGVTPRIIPPWVFQSLIDARATQVLTPPAKGPEPIWLYSGNLGRAHEWQTLLDAQRIMESPGAPWRLVFQGGGPAWPAAQEYAARLGLARCDWRPYVPEDQLPASLLAADVLAVTQKPETCGLLWPTSWPSSPRFPGPSSGSAPRTAPSHAILPGCPRPERRPSRRRRHRKMARRFRPQSQPHAAPRPVAIRAAGLREWVDMVEANTVASKQPPV